MQMLQRLYRETGREYALRVIRDNIIRLELAPGCLISENELATELGLSRTPVREALLELAQAKVVEISPQKRSVVAPIDPCLVEEARFTRDVLECAVIRLVCQTATDADKKRLDGNVALQEFYRENDQIASIMELDNQLHRDFFAIARKEQAYALVQRMAIHFDRIRTIALNGIRDLEIVEDHRKIVEAVKSRDEALAVQVMKQHLNRCSVDTQAIQAQFPHYFTKTE